MVASLYEALLPVEAPPVGYLEVYMSKIECPVCNRIDQAQRVTAIVKGETHDSRGDSTTIGGSQLEGRTDYYAGRGFDRERVGDGRISADIINISTTHVNVTQQSRLANKLALPTPPAKPSYSLGTISGMLVKFLAGISAFLVWVLTGDFFSGLNMGFLMDVLLLMASLIPPVFAWVIVEELLEKIFLQIQYPAQERDHTLAQYEIERKRWDAAFKRWSAMFYCRRCDVVYIPDDAFAPVPPEDTITLAYAGTD